MRITSPKLNLIYKACMKASKSLIRDFGEVEKLQVSSKGPGDFVTSADKRTEKIIVNELLNAYPDYGILSEEMGEVNKHNKNNRWIIDPIDGTSNFLNGIPHFSISIGYEENNSIKCGLIFDPIKNELFFAEQGNGAFMNNSRIRVSKKRNIKDSILVSGGPKYSSKIKESILEEYNFISKNISIPIRKFGSASLDLPMLHVVDLMVLAKKLNYWDIAAGEIILKESGGFIENLNPKHKEMNKMSIIASNSLIHQDLVNLLTKKNIE